MFDYLIPQDNAQYKQEIKNMRKHFREGKIVDVKAGKEFQINGSALYPLDMKMRDLPCHAYMLLRRNGLFDDAEYTPYFFKSKTTRDEVLEWMQRWPATWFRPYLRTYMSETSPETYGMIFCVCWNLVVVEQTKTARDKKQSKLTNAVMILFYKLHALPCQVQNKTWWSVGVDAALICYLIQANFENVCVVNVSRDIWDDLLGAFEI